MAPFNEAFSCENDSLNQDFSANFNKSSRIYERNIPKIRDIS